MFLVIGFVTNDVLIVSGPGQLIGNILNYIDGIANKETVDSNISGFAVVITISSGH